MENKIISYCGRQYKFVANVDYATLFNHFDEADNMAELNTIFGCHEYDKFIELIVKLGRGKTPMNNLENAYDIIVRGDKLVTFGENVMGDEEYDLYELAKD